MRELFHGADADRNGQLSPAEFKQALRGVDLDLSETEVQVLVHAIDSNDDGHISMSELYQARAMQRSHHVGSVGVRGQLSSFGRVALHACCDDVSIIAPSHHRTRPFTSTDGWRNVAQSRTHECTCRTAARSTYHVGAVEVAEPQRELDGALLMLAAGCWHGPKFLVS